MYDVSLICEEDLLTTIFYACDIEHTGKVAVSKIVDYLRHTTSRGSEDSGLEELCNMLDPDQKDVSMDLETYHAIMKEWIEDCKRKWEDGATEEPIASMEDLEFKVHRNTSEAKKIHVQMNVTSGSLEAFGGDVSKGDMETSDLITCVADLQYNNQKLQEENNKLKLTLEAVDETNNKLLADNEDLRQQIKSIQHSVLKAKSLEEELEEAKNNLNLSEEKRQQILCHNKQLNIRNSMDTDELQKKILDLSKNAAELQIQAHIYESTVVNKEASLIQKEQDIKELKLTIVECSSIIEQAEASEAEELVMTSLQWVKDPDVNMQQAWERKLVVLKQELGEKRHLWIQKLHLLEKYKESLDKDFIRMAGNLRRTKTEQLHLRKELSARQREIETAKQLQEETAGWAEALGLELQKATKQLEDASKQKRWKTRKCCAELESDYSPLPTSAEPVKGKQLRCSKQLWSEGPASCVELRRTLRSDISYWRSTPLLDALTLETSCPNNSPAYSWDRPCRQSSGSCAFESRDLGRASASDVKWKICSAGNYTDADLPVSITMMDSSLTEIDCAEPSLPASWIPSSDHLTSPQEVLTSSLESTAPVTGCLVMEEKSPKCSREKEEDVPTSIAMEKDNDKDPAGPVSGADLTAKESCPVMEEHKTAFQNILKQGLEADQEKRNNKEQSKEAPALVPSRKGSSPTAGGIKGDKTKQNEPDSPNEKEVEAEFLRLSLGFKCDLFTLDKRVRLEERSRDLAEENLKKEITNALKMLEALVPLCEEDNQAQEIIKKLQKSLQFLSQYAARVASKAEMLGAINQESRVSKAVEVMIQHVENLKRMYAKEHAELEELKQVLLQNERSFSSLGDRDESANKKLPNSFKPSSSLRRVSIATLPRSAGNAGVGLPLAQFHEPDGEEWNDKFNRRSSSWGRLGAKQNEKRPSLQRFISTYSWAEYEDEHAETKHEQSESPAEVQETPSRKESVSEKGKYSSKWNLESVCNLMSSWASHFKTSFSNANKTLWVSVSILVLLAALTSFLTGLSLQRPADAAPVGTGDSWTSLQQLLWPYTGLQHNGPPPV
ncbi:inositol 1,4,5-triphosphate receptor associated 2 [Grus japonensis]|uniref:Inositol 1,4,5-triphosphate receptor associated 2 n=1 Tax=Grus japonensis TaxID=30415 RepID=A0ABC9VUU0_GRUJA